MRKQFLSILIVFAVILLSSQLSAAKKNVKKAPKDTPKNEPAIIYSPKQNLKTTDERVKLSGKIKNYAEDLFALTVNRKEIKVKNNGAFDAVLLLHPGKNSVYLNLTDNNGESKTAIRKILRIVKYPDLDSLFEGQQHWAKKQITEIATLGIIEPYPDGNFLPNNAVTRGEFATWLSRALALPLEVVDRDVFQDVPQEHWRAPYIQAVVKKGYMAGIDASYFGIDDYISRINAIHMALKADGVTEYPQPSAVYFEDITVDDPRNAIVSAAAAKGISIGVSRSSHWFDPDRNITRAEAVSLISGLQKVKNKAANINNWEEGFSDPSSLSIVNALPVIIKAYASPESVVADGKSQILIRAHVSDPDGLEDVSIVKVDLSQFGGPPDAVMYDDATHGDASIRDGIYSLSFIVNADVSPGRRSAIVTVIDRSGVPAGKDFFVDIFPLKRTK